MVLEATVVCIDNSEWMRNGDYDPSRLQAQADAVNLLAGAKTQGNPENAVGVITLAGAQPRVLATPTPDLGKVLSCIHGVRAEGRLHLATGVQVRPRPPPRAPPRRLRPLTNQRRSPAIESAGLRSRGAPGGLGPRPRPRGNSPPVPRPRPAKKPPLPARPEAPGGAGSGRETGPPRSAAPGSAAWG